MVHNNSPAHRVVIASLFLPETVSLGESSEASTPTFTAPQGLGSSVAANRALGASNSLPQSPKSPSFARTFSTQSVTALTPKARSIVEDLQDKHGGASPQLVQTPAQESANPFAIAGILNPLATAVHALMGDSATPSRAGKNERLQPRVSRKNSRSSSARRTELERTKWHIETNPHCNGGLRNAVASVGDRLRRRLWVGVLGTPTDKMDKDLRQDINLKMRTEANCQPVWVPDQEFSKCYDEFCHQVLWPSLHYAVPDAPKTKAFYESASWAQYVAVNQKFADAITANYEEGDISEYITLLLCYMSHSVPQSG